MKIRVLGAFGSELPCCNLTGFLINNSIMIDAGTLSTALSIEEQVKISHVVLSHAHLDHTKGLPFMADNVIGKISEPVRVVAVPDVLDVIKAHLFNNKIWPDFTVIPTSDDPVLSYNDIPVNEKTELGRGLSIRPIWVNHTVPTTGFVIWDNDKAIVYSGDTRNTEEIWKVASELGDSLKAVFIETSFPNRMRPLAELSGHLTPEMLGEEVGKIKGYTGPVYVYHVKSQYLIDIEREIDAIGRKDIIVVRDEMEWEI
jgi:cAMP phosphodiesterase